MDIWKHCFSLKTPGLCLSLLLSLLSLLAAFVQFNLICKSTAAYKRRRQGFVKKQRHIDVDVASVFDHRNNNLLNQNSSWCLKPGSDHLKKKTGEGRPRESLDLRNTSR